MNVLDLFSGIGGFSLGLERTGGFRTVAFCEIEPYARKVLRKHWPEVPIYDDVRTLTAAGLAADGHRIDVVTAGFPCQDISTAGKGAGIDGERSGLWSEVARLTGELRPRYVLLENVAALLNRGLERVLGDLAAIGYDCEWHCIPASHIGAPHRRDRWWAVAYPHGESEPDVSLNAEVAWGVADAASRSRRNQPHRYYSVQLSRRCSEVRADSRSGWWATEPDVGRVAHGVPQRVDRLRGLGNAVVPQIPELIGRAILQAEQWG